MALAGSAFEINEGLDGAWFEPATAGQGILVDVDAAEQFVFLAWFTFHPESGEPFWLTAQGSYSGRHAELILNATERLADGSTTTAAVGRAELDFSDCESGSFQYEFGDQSGRIELIRLLADSVCQGLVDKLAGSAINPGLSGAWFDPAQAGEGLLFDVSTSTDQMFVAWFGFDQETREQRWRTAQGALDGEGASLDVFTVTSGLFDQPSEPTVQQTGTARVAFNTCSATRFEFETDDGDGFIDLVPLLDDALCQSLTDRGEPEPAELADDQPLAFVDVNLVDTSGNTPVVIPHQVVTVRERRIESVGPYGLTPIAADMVRIDGDGRFLSPGLTEMHMHISVGGQFAAWDSGLLLIANGVTTVLNMGDSFNIDVPQLGAEFADRTRIGPTLLAGNVAYGPPEDGDPRTILNPAEATAYAERLHQANYDYLKVYWFLTPATLDQFEIDAERLSLPIIGHLPRTRPMGQSLARGHRLAAHVQEPFVTFMDSRMDSRLIAPAADLFVEHGTYLSPTLVVFESYFGIYGGNRPGMDQLLAREGNQYVRPNIRRVWDDYFDTTAAQGGSPGGLDQRYELFSEIVREFHARGVPLLVGTDAPGFPGVASGFAVHEEMRLLQEAGLSAADVLRAATTNAGKFIDETLNPVTGTGWIAPGRQADLILIKNNPLEDLSALRRPDVVVAAGQLWSRESLDPKLQFLGDRYGAKSAKTDFTDPAWSGETLMCVDHLNELGRLSQ